MISADGGKNWYFTNPNCSSSSAIATLSEATGISTNYLHVGTPSVLAGTTVLYKVVVMNTGDVTEKNLSVKDTSDDPTLNNKTFTFGSGNATTVASLAPGAALVSNALSAVALIGCESDTATVTGTNGNSNTVLKLDTDSVGYTGTFSADCDAHTVSWWSSRHSSWDEAIVNGQKGILLGDYKGTAWLGGSSTSTPSSMSSVPTGTLFITDAAAVQLLTYGSSSTDVRQQTLAQAIATQLNIDNGVSDPGYYPGANPNGHDLIGEAVKWLTGAGTFGTGGKVDTNGDRILQAGSGSSYEFNTSNHSLTSATQSTSSSAWTTYYDPNSTVATGDIMVNGQDIKNALAAFNNSATQLITSMAGYQVGWNASAPTDVHLNNPDAFWGVLKDQGVIAGPTHA